MFLRRFGRLLNIFYIQGSFEAFYNIQEAFENLLVLSGTRFCFDLS
jgi:hypothetical protein